MKDTELDYTGVFQKIIKDIENHPYLELDFHQVNQGISAKYLTKIKEKLFQDLPYFESIDMKNIFQFYSEMNGLTLSWKISSDLDHKTYNSLKEKITDLTFPEDRNEILGKINILPFEEVFLCDHDFFNISSSGDHFTEFDDFLYEGNSFSEILFLFDVFSDTECMSFIADNDDGHKVILLQEDYKLWNHSKVSYFHSYMKFLAATRGLIESRIKTFSEYRGDKTKDILWAKIPYGTTIEPDLFKIPDIISSSL